MKPLNSLGFKLSLLSSLLVLGVIGLMANRILRQTRESFISEMTVRAEFFARACREALFPNVDSFQLHFHQDEAMHEKGVVYAEVMDSRGVVLSFTDVNQIGNVDNTPEGRRAVANQFHPLVQTYVNPKDQLKYYDISAPVMTQNQARRVGTVRLGFTEKSLEQALWENKKHIILIAILATLAAVSGTIFLVGWIMRPLPLLARAAQEIGQGNLNARVEWKSRDEIGVLAETFNEMADENARAFSMLKEEKEKLDTVFTQTRDGLLWADPAGGILLMNPTARQLLSVTNQPPVTLQEAFAAFEAKPSVEELIRHDKGSMPIEFRRRQPKLLILAGAADRVAGQESTGSGGILLVFRDVTLEKREESLSRSVLSLISHKLRTPLTVTLGYQQLLEQGDEGSSFNEFQKKSLAQMRVQTERLRYLVEKLLIFATVQNPETIPLETALCLPKEVVERAIRSVHELIESKKAIIEYDPELLKYLNPVMADSRHLTEALKNLIENAIKFNSAVKDGEKKVKIEVTNAGENNSGDEFLRFSVTDNGPGIPPEEQARLFRKFYQIDADFTGQIEGMGLGLAYVKNVAEAHKGKAGLNSTAGKGSTFYFEIPCV